MISKILKIQLVSLFIFTALAFLAFCYSDLLPDNYFSISSENTSINFFTYFVSSIVTMIGYYSGPWLLVSFVGFGAFYSFLYSKRESALDLLNIVTLSLTVMFFTYIFVPSFLGQGLRYVLNFAFSDIMIAVLGMISIISFLAGSFRDSFKDFVLKTLDSIANFPRLVHQLKSNIDNRKDVKALTNDKPSLIENIKMKVPSMLKGDEEDKPKSLPSFVQKRSESKSVNEQETQEEIDSREVPLLTKIGNPFAKPEKNEEFLKKDFQEKQLDDQVLVTREVAQASSVGEAAATDHLMKQPRVLKSTRDGKEDTQYYSLVSDLSSKKEENRVQHPDDKYFEEIIELIEDKLGEFKIDGKIINVLKGPVVDTFELELGTGVKVSKVTGATEDLSLALYGAPIRIVYPMKGRTTIGIEVPRNPREIIYLDEVLNTRDFQTSTKQLPVAMGKDAFGESFVVDLASMPHMLVAGATGAGKSVFINALLVSLLVKKSPKQMQLILIDPKQLELALYQNLPHLIMPVVTDAKTASISLLWAVQEMERRYSILKEFGVRNISGFNEKLKKATPDMLAGIHQHYEDSGAEEYELPYLVVIVDEFADLILTKAGKEIENNIARLAAKARAAGIHLVLATQRPSVDVITGVIKSNFPTRVSFRVTSPTDSRTILDKMGAEKLLGKGDMLYKQGIETTRVHSSYVDEEEIEALTAKLSDMPQEFNQNAMEFLENGGEVEMDEYTFGSHISGVTDDKSTDSLYKEAVGIVMEQRSASASMLQRRLRIGYNRAANLVEEMESKGVVGPAQGSKPRKVLISGEMTAE
ncbi:DNA translocase FtsK [Halobacteriovorax sp. GB3]|uniref:DNA translocase FtsK n=1 Tax=Halobacteriovorax sp. GB3 TaxID=2719615 RepID=UPI0023600F39|nr:DNA translocase FtsK [Halobacteriovorax sp. GB3]MDD0852391.1 DNA translocase FtsK [Halobacteriovorax sp. GB3]